MLQHQKHAQCGRATEFSEVTRASSVAGVAQAGKVVDEGPHQRQRHELQEPARHEAQADVGRCQRRVKENSDGTLRSDSQTMKGQQQEHQHRYAVQDIGTSPQAA